MAEEEQPSEQDSNQESLPSLNNGRSWWEIPAILAVLAVINIVAFLVSFGAGVIVTLPLTIFMAFLFLKDIIPRHRFPMGRPRRGKSA